MYGLLMLLLLCCLIAIHEAGHLLVGLWCGLFIEEYAVGIGPAIWKRKFKDIQYSIRMLPIGGYVKFAHPIDYEDADNDPTFISNAPPWKRAVVSLAGPAVNYLFGVLLLSGVWTHAGYEVHTSIGAAFWNPFMWFYRAIFGGTFSFDNVVGPVALLSHGATFLSTLEDAVYTCINLTFTLAAFNMIPIPALDGGRFVQACGEMVAGRRMNQNVELVMTGLGAIFLFSLMFFVLFRDIIHSLQ